MRTGHLHENQNKKQVKGNECPVKGSTVHSRKFWDLFSVSFLLILIFFNFNLFLIVFKKIKLDWKNKLDSKSNLE